MGFFDKIFNSPAEKKTAPAQDSSKPVLCPNCTTPLIKPPSSKIKCKSCQKPIYVRTDYRTDDKLYLSEKQKDDFDKAKKEHFFQKEWRRKLADLGITESEFEDTKQELAKKWGINPAFNDVVWRIFNNQVIKYGRNPSLHNLKMLYWTWSLFACEINSDPTNLLREAHKFELLGYKKTGFVKNVELMANQGCDACMKLNGKIFALDDLLKDNQVLPNKNCTHKLNEADKFAWCRCTFLSVIS